MSDIFCARCGEPWNSTGGINHTHSDLTPGQYTLLLEGCGCPCCKGDPERNHEGFAQAIADGHDIHEIQQETVRQWRRSVEALSEGVNIYMYETFEREPKKSIPGLNYDD